MKRLSLIALFILSGCINENIPIEAPIGANYSSLDGDSRRENRREYRPSISRSRHSIRGTGPLVAGLTLSTVGLLMMPYESFDSDEFEGTLLVRPLLPLIGGVITTIIGAVIYHRNRNTSAYGDSLSLGEYNLGVELE